MLEILCDKIYNMYIIMINEILSMFKTLLALGKTNPLIKLMVFISLTLQAPSKDALVTAHRSDKSSH